MNLGYSRDNLPASILSKPAHILEEGILAATTAISKGLSQDEATFACLQRIKSLEGRLKPSKVPSRTVPEHVLAVLKAKVQEPEVQQSIQRSIQREFLGKNALPVNQQRTLVSADFNQKNQLVLTFDTGEQIITKAVDTDGDISQQVTVAVNPVFDYIKFNTEAGYVVDTGELAWNAVDGTLDLGLLGGNVTLQIGQEQIVRFVNHTDNDFAEMQVVRIVGAQGNRLSAALAQSDSEVNSNTTFAVVTEPILRNQQGYATVSGLVRDIDTSAFPEGAVLYLSPTIPGGITSIIPVSPNRNVRVGYCVRSHATVGSIFVNIINDPELSELPDVLVQTPQNGDVLTYESSTGLWENKKSSYFTKINTTANVPFILTHNLNLFDRDAFCINFMLQNSQVFPSVSSVDVNSISITSTISTTNLAVAIQGVN